MEAQMRAAQLASMGRMSVAVAHEIRNPLNFINLSIDYLRDVRERTAQEHEVGARRHHDAARDRKVAELSPDDVLGVCRQQERGERREGQDGTHGNMSFHASAWGGNR